MGISIRNEVSARVVRLYYTIGMAFLFTVITVALTVIIGTLHIQTNMLKRLVQKAGG